MRSHESTYGSDHPEVAADLNVLGQVLRDLGQHAEARPLLERALRIRETTHGLDHPWTVQVREDLRVLPPA